MSGGAAEAGGSIESGGAAEAGAHRVATGAAGGETSGSRTEPAAILTAWRATERLYALATPGTEEAADLHALMRRLMDDYEWRVRGGVPDRLDRSTRRR